MQCHQFRMIKRGNDFSAQCGAVRSGQAGLRHVAAGHADGCTGTAQYGDPVADEQRLVHVVGDEDDGRAGARARCRRAVAACWRGSGRPARRTARPSSPRGAHRPGRAPAERAGASRRRGSWAGSPRSRSSPTSAIQRSASARRPVARASGQGQRQFHVRPDGAPRQQRVVLEHHGAVAGVATTRRRRPGCGRESGGSSPARARSTVDLPHPDGPVSTRISPGRTVRSSPSTTGGPP